MIKKIRLLIKENIKLQRLSFLQLKELEWAHIYHDSIRGKQPLESLSLNIGRWAGNYPFFYILNRILSDFKPKEIIEFGLGESSKFISTFLDHYLSKSNHTIIEHDANWKSIFNNQFKLSKRSEIKIFNLIENDIKGHKSNGYENIETSIKQKYDLYIVDGPFGSSHFSRYDIVNLTNSFSEEDELIIIIDDYNRNGEKETSQDIIAKLKSKNIKLYSKEYVGNKSIFVIATEKYKYVTSF